MNTSSSGDVFEEIRKHKESTDKYMSECYFTLEAIEETIRSTEGSTEVLFSPVKYFSCIMSSLSSSSEHYRSVGSMGCC